MDVFIPADSNFQLLFRSEGLVIQEILHGLFADGKKLIPGADFDPADLPEADSVFEVPSCAIEGTDNLYDYGTVEVTAFNDGDGEIIYSVYIKDANTPTDEGLYIGDTLEQVSSIYGTDRTENGNELVYTAGKTLLVIIVENDTVTSIEFRADI